MDAVLALKGKANDFIATPACEGVGEEITGAWLLGGQDWG